jgi:hypothetical protein
MRRKCINRNLDDKSAPIIRLGKKLIDWAAGGGAVAVWYEGGVRDANAGDQAAYR